MKPAILKRVERVWVNPTLKEDGEAGSPVNSVWVNLIIFNNDNSSTLTNPINHMGHPKHLF
jgi:hypothetical protein